mmetsp:Transcript_43404/g.92972  ORF Transcript_43404/g.92972 Transcript_43404/m.92972 type:complete len:399 (+) Transcript_43404:43-1239(+)
MYYGRHIPIHVPITPIIARGPQVDEERTGLLTLDSISLGSTRMCSTHLKAPRCVPICVRGLSGSAWRRLQLGVQPPRLLGPSKACGACSWNRVRQIFQLPADCPDLLLQPSIVSACGYMLRCETLELIDLPLHCSRVLRNGCMDLLLRCLLHLNSFQLAVVYLSLVLPSTPQPLLVFRQPSIPVFFASLLLFGNSCPLFVQIVLELIHSTFDLLPPFSDHLPSVLVHRVGTVQDCLTSSFLLLRNRHHLCCLFSTSFLQHIRHASMFVNLMSHSLLQISALLTLSFVYSLDPTLMVSHLLLQMCVFLSIDFFHEFVAAFMKSSLFMFLRSDSLGMPKLCIDFGECLVRPSGRQISQVVCSPLVNDAEVSIGHGHVCEWGRCVTHKRAGSEGRKTEQGR